MDDSYFSKTTRQEKKRDDFSELSGASHERWLVSYADFMTLLMAFFVVMYSLSQVSEDHFRVLSQALDKAFNNESIDESEITEGVPKLSTTASPLALDGNAIEDRRGNDSSEVPENFVRVDDTREQTFEKLVETDPVLIGGNERWLQLELPAEILFQSGGASLSETAKVRLSGIAEDLNSHGKEIRVEGFTDNEPVSGGLYPSNWELSSARASAVVRFLVEQGVKPRRLSAIGYGEHYPISTNSTEEGRNENRRIVISVAAHETGRPGRYQEVLRAGKRIYPYELRPALPDGVRVYGMEKDAKQAASSWLNTRIGLELANSASNEGSGDTATPVPESAIE